MRKSKEPSLAKVLLCSCGFIFEAEPACLRCNSPASAAQTVKSIIQQRKKLQILGVTNPVAWAVPPPLWCVVRGSSDLNDAESWKSMTVITCSAELRQFLGIDDANGTKLLDYLSESVLTMPSLKISQDSINLPFYRKGRSLSICRCQTTVNSENASVVVVVQFLAVDQDVNAPIQPPELQEVESLPQLPASDGWQPALSLSGAWHRPVQGLQCNLGLSGTWQRPIPTPHPLNLWGGRLSPFPFGSFASLAANEADDRSLLNDWAPLQTRPTTRDEPFELKDNFEAELESLRSVEAFYERRAMVVSK